MLGVNENLACIFHIDLLSPIAPKLYSYGLKLMDAISTSNYMVCRAITD